MAPGDRPAETAAASEGARDHSAPTPRAHWLRGPRFLHIICREGVGTVGQEGGGEGARGYLEGGGSWRGQGVNWREGGRERRGRKGKG